MRFLFREHKLILNLTPATKVETGPNCEILTSYNNSCFVRPQKSLLGHPRWAQASQISQQSFWMMLIHYMDCTPDGRVLLVFTAVTLKVWRSQACIAEFPPCPLCPQISPECRWWNPSKTCIEKCCKMVVNAHIFNPKMVGLCHAGGWLSLSRIPLPWWITAPSPVADNLFPVKFVL